MKKILKWLITIIIILVLLIIGVNHYNTYSTKELSIKDHVFNQNIENMYEGAKSYFGYNEKLPTKIGEEKKVTLEELVKEHIILMPIDSNNIECNAKDSYATVTKTKQGYKIKVSLTCSNVTDYIIRIESCNPYCTTGCFVEEKEEICKTFYEYKRKTDSYLTEFTSWSNYQTTEVKEDKYTEVQTKIETTLTCPTGYKLENDKCVKKYTEEKEYDAKLNITCPTGYKLENNKCIKSETITEEKDAKLNLSCESGYNLVNGICTKTTTTTNETNAIKRNYCQAGYTLENNICVKRITTTNEQPAKITYSCETGYTLNGTKCTKTTKDTKEKIETITCKQGFYIANDNSTCYQRVAEEEYSCKNGTLDGSKCKVCSITMELECNGICQTIKKETCKSENALVTTNYKTLYIGATKNYSCQAGYTLENNVCVKTITDTKDAIKNYSCETGTLSGNKCYTTIQNTLKDNMRVEYSCTTGTLSGNKCITTKTNTEQKEANKNYTCEVGFTLNDTKCINKETKTEEKDIIKNYTCTSGTLNGTKCIEKLEKTDTKDANAIKTTYYRFRTRKLIQGGTTIRWSESKQDQKLIDAGYQLTGNVKSTCEVEK